MTQDYRNDGDKQKACHEVFELEEVPGPDGVLHLLAQLEELVAIDLMLCAQIRKTND
jgi:hypothetical protein